MGCIRRELQVYHHDTYESINARIATLSGNLMAGITANPIERRCASITAARQSAARR